MENKIQIDRKRILLTLLRMAVGWYFVYEGISKLMIQDWSSYSYLAGSTGLLSGFYRWLASSEAIVKAADVLNIYGLMLIGISLFTGFFTRVAAVLGTVLLALYYFAYPPFGEYLYRTGGDHQYIVDKLFVGALLLLYIFFTTGKGFGIEQSIALIRKAIHKSPSKKTEYLSGPGSRRDALKNLAALPFLGLISLWAVRRNTKYGVDILSGATIQLNSTALADLRGTLPSGKIGDHGISRLILGGNLIGGSAHSRDLLYVSSLFKAYNTERKIYETLILAENAGINTINIGGMSSIALLARYKRMTGSKIKVIAIIRPNMKNGDYFEEINQAVDHGADMLQVIGNWCDWLVRDQRTDVIAKMLERIRSNGITAGLGAHCVDSLIACEKQGIIPDFYMKTMHHDNYWSAHPRENRFPFEVDTKKNTDHNKFHDNMFCLFPERTIDFVNLSKVPVIGFKVLAAGAIQPADGFNWAFKNGADFICVGMFDFQIVEDVNICIETLNKLTNRQRDWYG